MDCHGHGTHVAGTIGGATYGVAKAVRIHAVRVLNCQGSGDTNKIAEAIDWVAQNAQKMIVADRRIALVPASFLAAETGTRLLVHASPLLDALVSCFESLWSWATPVAASTVDTVSEPDRRLLAMLASGMKDRAIASKVQELMSQLDAATRFQAGLQAGRRGLL